MPGADLAKGNGKVFSLRHLERKRGSGGSKVSILGIYNEQCSSDSDKLRDMISQLML